ncbi:restriction endonuclease [Patescibacteria group bacterium]|nr:restriction endonuclease [Candidatus Micrarchaeota archaeon]MBU1758359.1 restriction endonuclease [Patescibacteria group bacterium]
MDIWVVKENGEKEKFDVKKVKRALRRSGLSNKEAEEILKELSPKLYDGMSTKKIYATVYGIVRDLRPEVTHKYNLKRALQMLGPAGYEFEDFIAKLLSLKGYNIGLRQQIQGKCVNHEIDVTASKDHENYLIECKFHNEPGTKCRIQTALYVYARYLDINAGRERKFTKPWLITNTKFSEDVVSYCECMDLPLLGWRYPLKEGLEALIDKTKCYPVSVIDMNPHTLRKLLTRKIVTVMDIPTDAHKLADMVQISLPSAKKIIEKAEYAK